MLSHPTKPGLCQDSSGQKTADWVIFAPCVMVSPDLAWEANQPPKEACCNHLSSVTQQCFGIPTIFHVDHLVFLHHVVTSLLGLVKTLCSSERGSRCFT